MPDKDDDITLKQAAKLAGITPRPTDDDSLEVEHPANQPGAEATAALEAMLAAGRRGKVVR